MHTDSPEWAALYDPDEHIGEASADELCLWFQDKLYEYAGMAHGVTTPLCLDATRLLLQWLEEGHEHTREATGRERG